MNDHQEEPFGNHFFRHRHHTEVRQGLFWGRVNLIIFVGCPIVIGFKMLVGG